MAHSLTTVVSKSDPSTTNYRLWVMLDDTTIVTTMKAFKLNASFGYINLEKLGLTAYILFIYIHYKFAT